MAIAGERAVGILVVDKPGGMTSRAVVDRALGWFPRGTRGGHAGTLDPLATGVLLLCFGSATRLVEYLQRMKKTYRARLLLGATSDTDDADGNITPTPTAAEPSEEAVRAGLLLLVGEGEQIPPSYSAAKVQGQRAYRLARAGQAISLAAKKVQIESVNLVEYRYPNLEIQVVCGKGTYIRSVARDLGQRLGCGAFIATLRRTQIGPFDTTDSLPLDAGPVFARAKLMPLSAAVSELPSLVVDAGAIALLRSGRALDLTAGSIGASITEAGGEVAVFDELGGLVAVAGIDKVQKSLVPRKVFV